MKNEREGNSTGDIQMYANAQGLRLESSSGAKEAGRNNLSIPGSITVYLDRTRSNGCLRVVQRVVVKAVVKADSRTLRGIVL